MLAPRSLLCIIANYDFSAAADHLKAGLSVYYETLLLDSSSPDPPRTVDIQLPNWYYTGLWNQAVQLALEAHKTWLLFVASDVEIEDIALLARCVSDVLEDESIGIYTPSLRLDSRVSFQSCFNQASDQIRDCALIEGFFFLARTSVLAPCYPVDRHTNRYGWGIDVLSAYHAHQMNYRVVADDRLCIYHPPSYHEINREVAVDQFYECLGDPAVRAFFEHTLQQIGPVAGLL
jgi:hypothetical protein